MMGYPFAVQFAAFASQEKHVPVKSIVKVKGNPGQSKHLETAKASILDLELDFVNLRDEEYADDSRIPTKVVRCVLFVKLDFRSPHRSQTYGTPLQDALRRDTTINSLFYNVHTRSVEDHCGKVSSTLANVRQ